ncbi:N-acetylmuramoyl-L-alanine amidase [Metasolibacillus fluoroglycofenilyticus]|uniref:N-acetylmuramoyl-L-alanine amidase n=1 Tax=Metasolibacillus fluoroglycofenilyticus TaxID=1239396 RepID=UPI000D365BEC|nr:N-acetylmuramoyl-L-alanine amidase [Metasolibacillus fluoroglycofenilyticus]
MKKTFSIWTICAMLILTMLPTVHSAKAAQDDYIVNAEILYLREGPGLSYPILETLKEGQLLSSTRQQGDWMHVKVNNKEGWVAKWLIKPTTATEQDKSEQQIVISQVDKLNVRAEPSLSSTVLTQLPLGAETQLLQQQEEWVQIQYGNVIGWVSTLYITVNEKQQATVAEEQQEETSIETLENDPNTFTIVVDTVNVRKKASTTSKILGVATKDQQYKVLSRKNNWVEIQYSKKKSGWIYSFYGTFTVQQDAPTDPLKPVTENVTIIYNGTNLREQASTSSAVVQRADAGQQYSIIAKEGEWYKIAVGEKEAYVANWVVSASQSEAITTASQKNRKNGTLQGLTIVIDPGHGGNDPGTTGVRGTYEKGLTLQTAELLKSKLRAAGANVELTREADVFVDLRKRIAVGHQANADAFISLHYDANEISSVTGFTTYYYGDTNKGLAEAIQQGLEGTVNLRSRGAQFGNFLVLRENRQNAILIELGYLSNAAEEAVITTDYYREQATLGIYQGLLNYFNQ